MSLSNAVREKLNALPEHGNHTLSQNLLDAERLADQFSEIKPVPYIVPIEMAIGTHYSSN